VILHAEDPMAIVKQGSSYVMTLNLPLTEKKDLDLSIKNDELFIRVGPYRRTIMLPKVLAMRDLADARLTDGRLEINFEERR
jgi:arsenite-transporting ATPase